MHRRHLLAAPLAATVPATLAASAPAAARGASGRTYVLLHGAWHGGWCWRDVADLLQADGHRVLTPTQTGLGERAHLLSAAITLETFINDLTGVLRAEEVEDAILVGHSFAGSAISGAAERLPGRIRHLVYLDALMLPPGRSVFDTLPPEVAALRRRQIAAQGGIGVPPPPPTSFGIPADHPALPWLARRLTPQPAGTYDSPLPLRGPVGAGLPCTYVACTDPPYALLDGSRRWIREQGGFAWRELATGHDAMVTAPAELVRLLNSLG